MKPTIVAKTDIVYVWDCGIDSHRHGSEKAAYNCINNSPETMARRNEEIYEMSKRRWKTDVAKEFDLSVSRVTQIIREFERKNNDL